MLKDLRLAQQTALEFGAALPLGGLASNGMSSIIRPLSG